MNFYLSCLLAFPKTKNGILGFWEFGTFYFPLLQNFAFSILLAIFAL